jgi:YHS domain-containing protein
MSFTSSAGAMRRRFLWLGMLLAAFGAVGLAVPAAAGSGVNASSFTGTAIEGYDPVAYFTEGRPVEGESAFSHEWMDATWYFANAENRDLFATDPENGSRLSPGLRWLKNGYSGDPGDEKQYEEWKVYSPESVTDCLPKRHRERGAVETFV